MKLPNLPHLCHTLNQWVWQSRTQRLRGLQSFCHTYHTSFSIKETESRDEPHTLLAVTEESTTSIGMAGAAIAHKPSLYWIVDATPHYQVAQKVWQEVWQDAGGTHALPA